MPIRLLRNLLLTTEAICHHNGREPGIAHFRQERTLSTRNREVIFIFFESKRSCHAAATRFQHLVIESCLLQHSSFFFKSHDSFVMTVTLDNRPAAYTWRM